MLFYLHVFKNGFVLTTAESQRKQYDNLLDVIIFHNSRGIALQKHHMQ